MNLALVKKRKLSTQQIKTLACRLLTFGFVSDDLIKIRFADASDHNAILTAFQNFILAFGVDNSRGNFFRQFIESQIKQIAGQSNPSPEFSS